MRRYRGVSLFRSLKNVPKDAFICDLQYIYLYDKYSFEMLPKHIWLTFKLCETFSFHISNQLLVSIPDREEPCILVTGTSRTADLTEQYRSRLNSFVNFIPALVCIYFIV